MAADSDQERSEEPTGKRLEEARSKGQIARSKELQMMVVLLAGAVGLWLFAEPLSRALVTICKRLLSIPRDDLYDENVLGADIAAALWELLPPLGGWMALVALAAFVGSIVMGGLNFSSEAMGFRWSKMSPLAGIKRMFGTHGLVELIKSVAKVVVIAAVCYWLLAALFDSILHLSAETFPGNLIRALELVLMIIILLCASLAVIAVIDVPYQLWEHKQQLMMTKQEVRDEHKDVEGNPEIKRRIRRVQYEMSARRMMAEVPKADVVVTNPTHFSVALKYEAEKGAPRVVAKGSDELAMKIREIARAYEVPIISAPPLCRALYHSTELDREIPDGLFVAVAQVLAYVMQLKSWRKGRGHRPKPLPGSLPIPPELQR
ncbi:MAG: flagellar biosynthesis protein FlhB [Corallincola sp.]|nr:flagellar biosynthesis protein FlhB [Corallincola sp.]